MSKDELLELGKGLLFLITALFMIPILFFMDWGWDRWANLWGKSKASNGLFILFAPVMLFCFAISWLFANKWQSMLG